MTWNKKPATFCHPHSPWFPEPGWESFRLPAFPAVALDLATMSLNRKRVLLCLDFSDLNIINEFLQWKMRIPLSWQLRAYHHLLHTHFSSRALQCSYSLVSLIVDFLKTELWHLQLLNFLSIIFSFFADFDVIWLLNHSPHIGLVLFIFLN